MINNPVLPAERCKKTSPCHLQWSPEGGPKAKGGFRRPRQWNHNHHTAHKRAATGYPHHYQSYPPPNPSVGRPRHRAIPQTLQRLKKGSDLSPSEKASPCPSTPCQPKPPSISRPVTDPIGSSGIHYRCRGHPQPLSLLPRPASQLSPR